MAAGLAEAREACGSGGVADAFFQTGGPVGARNDFPVLSVSDNGGIFAVSGLAVADGSGVRNRGCAAFVDGQLAMASRANGNGGYYLDSGGVLRKISGDAMSGRSIAAKSPSYVGWAWSKGSGSGRGGVGDVSRATSEDSTIPTGVKVYGIQAYSVTRGSACGVNDSGGVALASTTADYYLARTDNALASRGNSGTFERVSHVQPSGGWEPADAKISAENERVYRNGGNWFGLAHRGKCGQDRFLYSTQDQGSDSSASAFCPSGMHPRGQDGVYVIGSSTGRTLSSLTESGEVEKADKHWCRSDVRYKIAMVAQNHGTGYSAPSGVTVPAAGTKFTAYGRIGCYNTAITLQTASSSCVYGYPVPMCTDAATRQKRNWNSTELNSYYTSGSTDIFPATSDGNTICSQKTVQNTVTGFSADPCVIADFEIYENRIPGVAARPGVILSHRTVTYNSPWNLHITSAHPQTASPPRDTTDPSGCADGVESRADHGTRINSSDTALPAGSPDRKSSNAAKAETAASVTLPSLSGLLNSQPPPDHSDDRFQNMKKNLAHRYASNIAEHTCDVKQKEAEAVLALLKDRAEKFSGTASSSFAKRYHSQASTQELAYSYQKYLLSLTAATYPTVVSTTYPYVEGYYTSWYNTNRPLRLEHFRLKETRWSNLKEAIETARQAHKITTDAASVNTTFTGSCTDHYDNEIERLEDFFSDTKTGGAGKIFFDAIRPSEEDLEYSTIEISENVCGTGYYGVLRCSINTREIVSIPGATEPPKRENTQTNGAVAWDADLTVSGESCYPQGDSGNRCIYIDTTIPTPCVLFLCNVRYGLGYNYTTEYGTHSATLTTKVSYNGSTTTITTSCTGLSASRTTSPYHNGEIYHGDCTHTTDNEKEISKALGTSIYLPAVPAPKTLPLIQPTDPVDLNKASVLGTYYHEHAARDSLESESDALRRSSTDALTLRFGNLGSNPDSKVSIWRDAYKTAYDNAYTQAINDMGGTNATTWSSFDWRYETSTLAWLGYQEDPATTYSESVTIPKDGTGCDLINIAVNGEVTVEATRLDFETAQYGTSAEYGTRTAEARTCKVLRRRTPELQLMYAPATVPTTVDQHKKADKRLDANTTESNSEFYYVDYQPTTTSDRLKLGEETEIFAVEVLLDDSVPVLCYQPGDALVAHVGARGVDAVSNAVFSGASGYANGEKAHCYSHSGLPQSQAVFVWFDDTAHSAMASVNVEWQDPQPADPKIVSKVGSTDDLKMMANSVILTANNVPYDDSTRTTSFYGTYYTFPATASPSGWDISNHPTLNLTSRFTQHQVQAKDRANRTSPITHDMVFKFVDCKFEIDDVAFVDNIASPYAFDMPSNWKQNFDSNPHTAPIWYYPAFARYEGDRRLDGRTDSDDNPITYGRNSQGGFQHPSYALEGTPSDGIGWGILYEDRVGQQQPVWAIYAPPAPTRVSNTQHGLRAPQVADLCGANTLNNSGNNPVPTGVRIGTPATLPPPASGNWAWTTAAWNSKDNPVIMWTVDDDPDRDDPWETPVTRSNEAIKRKQHNNLEVETIDTTVGSMNVFPGPPDASAGFSRLDDQDMELANLVMVNSDEMETELKDRAEAGGITCGKNWWYCFRPAPAGYRLWGRSWMAKRQL